MFSTSVLQGIASYIFGHGTTYDKQIPLLAGSIASIFLAIEEILYKFVYKEAVPFRHFSFALKNALLLLLITLTTAASFIFLPANIAADIMGGLLVLALLLYLWMIVEFGILLVVSFVFRQESDKQLRTAPGPVASLEFILRRKVF